MALCQGNFCPRPPQAGRQCDLSPSPCPCSYSQLPLLAWLQVPQVGSAIRGPLGCWNVMALPEARLILENPAWVVHFGGYRVSAAWHSSWAQLLTFLSRDKSPLCKLPLCGSMALSASRVGSASLCLFPSCLSSCLWAGGLGVHGAHVSPRHVPVPLDMKP